jgi:bifunctional pyridoxal-dependent enzyme with beta-cystathionase and maltose regulon repressor activities
MCTEIFYTQEGLDWLAYALSIVKENYTYLTSKVKGTLLTVSELESAYIIIINFEGYIKFIERWYNALKVKEAPPANMVAYYLGRNQIKGI